jgi:hypothetical protein
MKQDEQVEDNTPPITVSKLPNFQSSVIPDSSGGITHADAFLDETLGHNLYANMQGIDK